MEACTNGVMILSQKTELFYIYLKILNYSAANKMILWVFCVVVSLYLLVLRTNAATQVRSVLRINGWFWDKYTRVSD